MPYAVFPVRSFVAERHGPFRTALFAGILYLMGTSAAVAQPPMGSREAIAQHHFELWRMLSKKNGHSSSLNHRKNSAAVACIAWSRYRSTEKESHVYIDQYWAQWGANSVAANERTAMKLCSEWRKESFETCECMTIAKELRPALDVLGGDGIQNVRPLNPGAAASSADTRFVLQDTATPGSEMTVFAPNGIQVAYQNGMRGRLPDASQTSIHFDGLITYANGAFTLWDRRTGKEIRQVPKASITSMAISSNGRWVLDRNLSGHASVWDTVTGNVVRTFDDVDFGIAISADGSLAILSSKTPSRRGVYEVSTGRLLLNLNVGNFSIAQLSPNGTNLLTWDYSGFVNLWDLQQRRLLFRLHVQALKTARLNADGKSVATLGAWGQDSRDGQGFVSHHKVQVWDTQGRSVFELDRPQSIDDIQFTDDGKKLLIVGADVQVIGILDRQSAVIAPSPPGGAIEVTPNYTIPDLSAATTTPDGKSIVTLHRSGKLTLWSLETGESVAAVQDPDLKDARGLSVSASGEQVLTGSSLFSGGRATLWNLPALERGVSFRRDPDGFPVSRLQWTSQDALVASNPDRSVRLNLLEGNAVFTDIARSAWPREDKNDIVLFAPDGLTKAVSSGESVEIHGPEGVMHVHDAKFPPSLGRKGVRPLAFSPSGKRLLLGHEDGFASVVDAATGDSVGFLDLRLSRNEASGAFSGDFVDEGEFINDDVFFAKSRNGRSSDWRFNAASRIAVDHEVDLRMTGVTAGSASFTIGVPVHSVATFAISPRRERIATGGQDGTIRVWDTVSGRKIAVAVQGSAVEALRYSPDGSILASAGTGGLISLWRVDSDDTVALASFVISADKQALVFTPSGRFDTSNIESLGKISWIVGDEPFTPLPPEIFMRDYFEPRLLPRVLAGEKLSELPALDKLNRVQPQVKIISAEPEHKTQSARDAKPDTVRVTVEVAGDSREFGLGDARRRMATGVYDLRVFRDGQLVGQFPSEPVTTGARQVGREQELAQWREDHAVVKYAEGASAPTRIVFEGIRLPRIAGKDTVEFSAYAFNVDRVKSAMSKLPHPLPKDLPPRAQRAYVVTIGVNAFEDEDWDLKYAANDARQSGRELKRRLKTMRAPDGSRQYEKVVWVPLISDAHKKPGKSRRITSATADKKQIEAVLKTLAGLAVERGALAGIDSASDLRRVNPEDLLIIVISTHGLNEDGTFYFLPADIDRNFSPTRAPNPAVKAAMLARAVSNDELAQWLRGVDAVDQVIVIDACRSAASVQSAEFKPGPMGSRGLGQLAYDKGMRILAATQVEQDAVDGTDETKMSLLVNALIAEGLRAGKADNAPADGRIMLSEWLNYANQTARRGSLQQPSLFDFARGRDLALVIAP